MRVLINGIAALERKTGVGYYISSLHEAMQRCRAVSESVELYPTGFVRETIKIAKESCLTPNKKKQLGGNGSQVKEVRSTASRIKSLITPSRELSRNLARRICHAHFKLLCKHRGIHLYHEPNYLPWLIDLPTITTILDLSVLRFPEWHPKDRVKAYEQHFFRGLRQATHLIAISEFTRQEMIEHLGILPERITAIHIGIRDNFRPLPEWEVKPVLQKYDLQPNFFLHVGTIEPRKNLSMLMRAYARLPAITRQQHPLLLVGGWGWQSKEIVDTFENVGKPAGVQHLGYVPDEDLPALFNAARALVYPSHYEGFGLPPVEMLACGGLVLSSTAGSLVEVMGSQGVLIDANNEDAWTQAMENASDESWAKNHSLGAIDFASRYTWDACARGTMAVYRRFAAIPG
jgi:glycosyltransferase involved in cell wall biosynthesis